MANSNSSLFLKFHFGFTSRQKYTNCSKNKNRLSQRKSRNYTIDDIEIFILTGGNRATELKQSIESILNQTAKVKTITVLDKESTDNTEEIVQSFKDKGVKYIKTKGLQSQQ